MRSWIDTHCHLQLAGSDPETLLARAIDVERVVVPGIDAASSSEAANLAATMPDRVDYAAGLHPHEASRWPDERDAIAGLLADAVAVGETGLDFYRNLSPPEAQHEAFVDQLRMARERGKPTIVHCRDAFQQVHEIIEREGGGSSIVLHCWTGGPKWSKRFAELGVTFSFAGPVAFETGDTVRRGAAVVDPATVMVETDTPYLAPPPHRKEDNEPAHVALVGAALATVWGMEVDDVAHATSARARSVFGL